ncbi:MAG TPA: hypothetical protein VM369_03100 [Candidatus Binatia bacterium]|nr:hypothetical protein [Candidatus Binatia bacterium]
MARRRNESHWLDAPGWWKKWKPLRWLAIGGVAAAVFSVTWTVKTYVLPVPHAETERFTGHAADPVPMLGGLRSYDSLEAVRARLDAAKAEYKVEQRHATPSSKYPPHDRDTLVAAKYLHLGTEGVLTLEFFNDRLYEAQFVPGEADPYADRLHASDRRLKRDRAGRAEQVMGALRVATNVDFAGTDVGRNLQTKPFVLWQDLRLVAELDEWDRRFVALPPPSKR